MDLVKYIFSNFWIWLGFMLILSCIGTFIYNLYSRFLTYRNIQKHGYPPAHYDFDGSPKKEKHR